MPSEPSDRRLLIVGLGLAGSALAWELLGRGLGVVVVDRPVAGATPSRVAAGLITPVTGKRLTLGDDWRRCWPTARAFYRSVERAAGRSLLEERPSLRVLADAEERALFGRRLAEPGFASQARPLDPGALPAGLAAPHGAFEMPAAARLDTGALLDATRERLAALGALVEGEIDPDRDLVVGPNSVSAPRLGIEADRVVLCTGPPPAAPARRGRLPLAPAKGEVLTVEAPRLRLDRVAHRGVWVVPLGEGLFRVGATYDHDAPDPHPTAAGRSELLARLAPLHDGPVRVVDHRAAFRPTTSDRQPLARFCERSPRVGWLNGLGSKGALWAPRLAARLAQQCGEIVGK